MYGCFYLQFHISPQDFLARADLLKQFTRPENTPFFKRWVWYFKRAISSFFCYPISCPYIPHGRQSITEHGYLLMEYIDTEDATMLSETWTDCCQNHDLRANLFKDLSRIILSLSRFPMPCIGSWTIDNHGVLKLANRPLIHQFHSLENEHIPTNIPRSLTYTTTDAYYLDLLACHDSRIRNQPNSISDEEDGHAQIANLFTMRGLLPYFTKRDLRHGPFVFNLTDLHGSNIFVDRNWRIRYLIDLEWACSLPIEMLAAPHWITSRAIDELEGDEFQKFDETYKEFTDIFEKEEKSFPVTYATPTYRTDIMRRGWKIGNFWYFHALKSPKGLYNLFWQHIQPIFQPRHDGHKPDVNSFAQVVSPYWNVNAQEVMAAKLDDKAKYEQNLRELFRKDD